MRCLLACQANRAMSLSWKKLHIYSIFYGFVLISKLEDFRKLLLLFDTKEMASISSLN